MANRWRGVVLLVVAVAAALLFVSLASASNPVNGDFTGSLTGWNNYDGAPTWVSAGGHAGGDALRNTSAGYTMSEPFHVDSSSAVLSFWGRCPNDASCVTRVQVWDWDTSSRTTSSDYNLTSTESNETYVLSSFVGHNVSVGFWEAFNPSVISAVSLSHTTDVTTNIFQGDFTGSLFGWQHTFGGCGLTYSSSEGHTASGSAKWASGCDNWIRSVPFLVTEGDWRFYIKGGTNVNFSAKVFDYTVGGRTYDMPVNLFGQNIGASWAGVDVDLSSYVGHYMSWEIYINTLSSGDVYIDDVCPLSGCAGYYAGTPTATSPATSTSTATNTPLPTSTSIPTSTPDGSCCANFPTQIPYPTSQPYPTQIPYPTFPPYPTPLYGEGTPAPVGGGGSTGLCPSDDPCYVLNPEGTPVHVWIDGGIVKVDDSTPVAIRVNTPVWDAPGPRFDLFNVTSGESYVADPVMWLDPDPIDITDGATGFPLGLNLVQQQVGGCLPCEITQAVNITVPCAYFNYVWIGQLSIGGLNLLPFLEAISGAMLIVFLIRQLQER